MLNTVLLLALVAPPTGAWEFNTWVEMGPERGHVLDMAVGPGRISAATRAGVLSTTSDLGNWNRDPAFPPEVRRLAYCPDGSARAATLGRLWTVDIDEARASVMVDLGDATTAVDLLCTRSGTTIAALRGRNPGLMRVASGLPSMVVSAVDPWTLESQGTSIWLGTLDSGLWRSDDDGLSFDKVMDDSPISALGMSENGLWLGTGDGRIQHPESPGAIARVAGAVVTSMSPFSGGMLLAVRDLNSQRDTLYTLAGSNLRALYMGPVDHDSPSITITGTWSLPGQGVLVGSFRRGPLLFDGQSLSPRRNGFRATITGDAAVDSRGRILLALMGTGVYLSSDDARTWLPQHGRGGPVTDSVAVAVTSDGFLVADFEGLVHLGSDQKWQRHSFPSSPEAGRRMELSDVAVDRKGRWWALDRRGGLWLVDPAGNWTKCRTKGGLSLEGSGPHLLLATGRGLLQAGECQESWAPISPTWEEGYRPRASRADGGWVAVPGSLWKEGTMVSSLPRGSVAAMQGNARGCVLAMADGAVLDCAQGCSPMPVLPERPVALGRFNDGRLWAAESRGTFLLSGQGEPPSSWSALKVSLASPTDLVSLERAPWNREGQAIAGPKAPEHRPAGAGQAAPVHRDPGPAAWTALGNSPSDAAARSVGADPEASNASQEPGSSRLFLLVGLPAALVLLLLLLRRNFRRDPPRRRP